MLSDPVVDTIRRELRRLSDVKIESDDLRTALKLEVIKREVIEGDKADAARRKVAKAAGKMLRNRKNKGPEALTKLDSISLSLPAAVEPA